MDLRSRVEAQFRRSQPGPLGQSKLTPTDSYKCSKENHQVSPVTVCVLIISGKPQGKYFIGAQSWYNVLHATPLLPTTPRQRMRVHTATIVASPRVFVWAGRQLLTDHNLARPR
ncbi:hypothetical protein BgiBS90_036789 [Biomphalaria glabrata]|nr:hypothetical protein BgiBS90_036789 [Biomphalaria glabrata]